jgi:asparagine synthase (glutamine-hydrolysing)
MCGIAGVVGFGEAEAARAAVRVMCDSLARRGPDGQGMTSWNDAIFGHRRLAIYDLSDAGRQPMVTPDRQLGVVFNGAIYNYRELRDCLPDCQFVSRTDTEVLLHGYRTWGIDELVRRLRGMFAFALWDDARRTLYLVRDRLGVKPLVYTTRGGALAFASTVRALSMAGYTSDLDPIAIQRFLDHGFVPDQRSVYQGVMKVPAATIVEVSLASPLRVDSLTSRQYWTPPAPVAGMPFEAAVERTRDLLLDAVKVRLHADVPVGALLSGGIDSSLVCWGVQALGADIHAYTVATPGDPWDESAAARYTAERLGLKHSVVELSDRDLPEIDELISAYGEPFGSASALGMLRVCRTIAGLSPVKVLLTGDGGDDVFLGYPRHRHLWLASQLAQRAPWAGSLWRAARPVVPKVGPLSRGGALLDYTTWGLGGYLAHAAGGDPSVARGFPQTGRTVLTDFLEYEFNGRFLGEYQVKVDGASMYHGLEARAPFMDQHLWEFASSVPFDVRLRRGRLKAILRELVSREISPQVARRVKRGFGVPVQRWLVGRWRSWAEALLENPLAEKDGWIEPGAASRLIAATREGVAPASLWYVVVLESWLRQARRA